MNDSMKKTFLTVLGVLVVVGALFISAGESFEGYDVGDQAKDFALPNIDGKEVSLSDFKDAKGFIVVFTCNTCPYAKMYESRIKELDNKYASMGFPVVAINPNDTGKQPGDSMEEMVKRAKEQNYTFPYLRDDSQDITRAYGATKTPHVYVLDRQSNGDLIVKYIGAIDDSPRDASEASEKYVESAVDALMQGKEPPVKTKRAIGCTIKWKDA